MNHGASSLQWGRRLTSTETYRGFARIKSIAAALQWGRRLTSTETRGAAERAAQGAPASMGPSTDVDGDARPRARARRVEAASMGPSTDVDGDLSRRLSTPRSRCCFNGAVD